MKQNVTVLGSGSWGLALSYVLSTNVNQVTVWGRNKDAIASMQKDRVNQQYLPGFLFPTNLQFSADLKSAVEKASHILIAVPSHAFHELLQNINPYLLPDVSICWASKGLDNHSQQLLHEILLKLRPSQKDYAVLSGPSFAKEVIADKPTAVTIASPAENTAKKWQQLFHNNFFRVYTGTDVVGVQLAGSVKNVLAIGAGINDALGFGINTRSALITRGLAEMIRLGCNMGANRKTFMGLAGLGDLILTCSDDQSRNRRLGLCLGRGLSIENAQAEIKQTIEGIITTQIIQQLAKKHQVEMPICQQIYRILYENLSPLDAVNELLARVARAE